MKALIATFLGAVTPLAMAAVTVTTGGRGDAGGLVDAVVYLIVLGVIVGILLFLVNRAPFIPPEAKTIIVYVIYFICAIFIINWLLGMTSNGPIFRFR